MVLFIGIDYIVSKNFNKMLQNSMNHIMVFGPGTKANTEPNNNEKHCCTIMVKVNNQNHVCCYGK